MESEAPPALDSGPTDQAGYDEGSGRKRLLRALSFRNMSAIYVLIAFIIIFSLWVPSTFLTSSTLQSVLYNNSTTALLAVGLVVPFAAGAFDISIGATVGFSAVVLGELVSHHHWTWPLGALIAIVGGGGVGVINALLVVRMRIDSIIATLAMMSVLSGLGVAIGNNAAFITFPSSFTSLGSNKVLGVTLPVWSLLAVAVAMYYVLERTAIGRSVYATGGGMEAARLAGVRTSRCIFWSLVVSGTIAGFAGVVLTARIGASEADLGPPYLLPAVAALFLGSTQFKNGRFNVWGSVVATYTLAVGVQGLSLAGASAWVPDVFDGVALAIAVAMTVRRRRVRTAMPDARAGDSVRPKPSEDVQPTIIAH